MSSDEQDTSRGSARGERSRPSRTKVSSIKSKQKQALELLQAARAKRSTFRRRVDEEEDEPLYVEVDDYEYKLGGFIERDTAEALSDELDDEVDSAAEDDHPSGSKKVKEKKPNKAKPKRGTITNMFQQKSRQQPETSVNIEDDPILNECLASLAAPIDADDAGGGDARDDDANDDDDFGDAPGYDINWGGEIGMTTGRTTPPATAIRNLFKRPASPTLDASSAIASRSVEAKLRRMAVDEEDTLTPSSLIAVTSLTSKINLPLAVKPVVPVAVSCQSQQQPLVNIGDVGDNEPADSSAFDTTDIDVDVDVDAEVGGGGGRNGVLRFYYLDAFEDAMHHPGTVYLFGRVRCAEHKSAAFETCCIVVKNVSRQIFFHKRLLDPKTDEPIADEELKAEVKDLLQNQFSITKYKFMLVKKRFLCRDSPQPDEETPALEVQFNANFGRISSDLSGRTFSRVFNTTTTSMERIVVEQEIKGPSWLDITGAEPVEGGMRVSHCQREYVLDVNLLNLRRAIRTSDAEAKLLVPGIRLLALNVMTAMNYADNEQQIVMISFVYDDSFVIDGPYLNMDSLKKNKYCLITKLGRQNVNLPFDLPSRLKNMGIDLRSVDIKVPDERALLNKFLAKMALINPDMIVAHDWSSQLATLVSRMEKYKCPTWHLLSRLKRSVSLSQLGRGKFAQWELTAGRLCLDSKTSAEELVRSRSYTMEDLVEQIIKPSDPNVKRLDLDLERITETFVSSAPKIDVVKLILWNWDEAVFSLRLVVQLNAIPLFVQITQIVGGVMSRTLLGGRAERNEFLLLHACKKNKIVAPDKYFQIKGKRAKAGLKSAHINDMPAAKNNDAMDVDEDVENVPPLNVGAEKATAKMTTTMAAAKTDAQHNNKKAQYTGGLVLEPKKGLYETFIVLLDFNSLYPSIIQEFNICFTTVPNAFADVDEHDLPAMPDETKPDGILKTEIRELVNRRRQVKALMKREDVASVRYKQYNIRQMGLKLTANSMYGCLGFAQSRFYAKTLAAMITSKGREVLIHTRDLVQAEGFSVIYGDTDSIMVNTNSIDLELAKGVAQKLKQIVNKNYRLLELDVDGIYKKLLLLKKKKYAGLAIDLCNESIVTRELKGLDIVRRDWSLLAKTIGDKVVDLILSSAERDEIVGEIRQLLADLRANLDAGCIERSKFEISKQLTRNPADYHEAKSQPHVLVALRLNATKKFKFRQGDVIKYVICQDGTGNSPMQRAYHLTELDEHSDLSIDINYYLAQQVHPVVARLCEPIEEIDAVQIAEALGIDASSYRRAALQNGSAAVVEDEYAPQFGLEQDFDKCEGFTYECQRCGKLNVIRGILADPSNSSALSGGGGDGGGVKRLELSLAKCVQCAARLAVEQLGGLLRQLVVLLRRFIVKYAQSPFVCDDVTCAAQCVLPGPEQWTNEGCVCLKCHQGIMRKTYTSKQLFDQQCFFKTIFDLDAFLDAKMNRDKRGALMSSEDFDALALAYRRCTTVVERYLALNDFNKVDLGVVLAPLLSAKMTAAKIGS